MNTYKNFLGYAILVTIVLLVDRITKIYALEHFITFASITPFLGTELTMNRGISWGLFGHENPYIFFVVSCCIVAVLIGLILYTRSQYLQGYSVWPETLVIAGAVSNLFDRFLYHGVVDFIVLSFHTWTWPVFNVADMCIVCGVFGMYIHMLQKAS